jgi:hypothetical protein
MVAEIHQYWIERYLVIAITPAVSMSVDRIEWQPSCTLLLPRLLLLEGQPTSWLLGWALQELPWARLSRGAGTDPWVEIVFEPRLAGSSFDGPATGAGDASTHQWGGCT